MDSGNSPTEARTKRPGVGVGVVVYHDGYVLLGERKGSHGAGELALPGGKVDPNESPYITAKRELHEETNLVVSNMETIPFWSFDCYEGIDRDFVTLYFMAPWLHKNPQIMEPDKVVQWDWYQWLEIPSLTNTFAGLKELYRLFPHLGRGDLSDGESWNP